MKCNLSDPTVGESNRTNLPSFTDFDISKHEILEAIRNGVSDAFGVWGSDVLLEIHNGVVEALPHGLDVVSAVREGVTSAMPKKADILRALAGIVVGTS